MRNCVRCRLGKPIGEFYKDSLTRDGISTRCKSCQREITKKSYLKNRKKILERARRDYRERHAERRAQANEYRKRRWREVWNWNLKKTYGITVNQYEAMYKRQNGICAICQGLNIDGRRLCVDHDHKTNKVRGLLCKRCNSMLGHATDSIEILHRAADYLEAPARVVGGYL